MKFLRIKHGLDPMPDEMKATQIADVASQADSGVKPEAQPESPRSRHARTFSVYVRGERFEVEVEPHAPERGMRVAPAAVAPATPPTGAPIPASDTQEKPSASASGTAGTAADEVPVSAPIPGVVLRYAVEVGQSVSEGDSVVVLEAMKMENTLPAPASGTVKALVADLGATVAKDAVLAVISI